MHPNERLGAITMLACPGDEMVTGTTPAIQPITQFGGERRRDPQERTSDLNGGVVYVLVERHLGNV